MANLFSDGFEGSNLNAWSGSLTDSGKLSVAAVAALAGSYGMKIVIDNTTDKFVDDETPVAETRYRFRFLIDPNSLVMAEDDEIIIAQAADSGWEKKVWVVLAKKNGQYTIRVNDDEDGSWNRSSDYIVITDALHSIEVDWKAATGAGNNDGEISIWIDEDLKQMITNINNDTAAIDVAIFGACGIDVGTTGTLFLDSFASNNDGTAIGENLPRSVNKMAGLGMVMNFGWQSEADSIEYIELLLANNIKFFRALEKWDVADRYALSKTAVLNVLSRGGKVIFGTNYSGTLTAANWNNHREAILAAAQWAKDNNITEFQIGNEEEYHIDGTTLTLAQLIINLKSLATEVQAIFTMGKISYACAQAFIDDWVTAGRGDIDLMASNLYMGEDTTYEGWRANLSALIDGFGIDNVYLSEFGVSTLSIDTYSTDEAMVALAMYMMIKHIKEMGITRAYFYQFNGDDFGILKSDGVTYRNLVWDIIKSSALQNGRNLAVNRSLSVNRSFATIRKIIKNLGYSINTDNFTGYVNCGTINLSGSEITLATLIQFKKFQTTTPFISSLFGVDKDVNDRAYLRAGDVEILNSQLQFILRFAGVDTKLTSIKNLEYGKWYHIGATYDGSSMKIFIDGVQDNVVEKTGSFTANNIFYVGYSGSSAGRKADAYFDETMVFKRAISAEEMLKLFAGEQISNANLLGYWKFDEGEGLSAIDSSGNGKTGTITDAIYSTDVRNKPRTAI